MSTSFPIVNMVSACIAHFTSTSIDPDLAYNAKHVLDLCRAPLDSLISQSPLALNCLLPVLRHSNPSAEATPARLRTLATLFGANRSHQAERLLTCMRTA
ncbi:hypothetical protein NliqN6_5955 [Naganishia liquefaciens]|uniref:Uncharacterized protein n=1 Tax=Naganishia liquefaciens TaxID=104408 RepID=A0A8H3TZ96_9TREE|nr:hypothetical protein NliqN6_5955 [Naganishia liquefaciens]